MASLTKRGERAARRPLAENTIKTDAKSGDGEQWREMFISITNADDYTFRLNMSREESLAVAVRFAGYLTDPRLAPGARKIDDRSAADKLRDLADMLENRRAQEGQSTT